MTDSLRSEFRKLLTVRSTYIAGGITLLFIVFMSFYIEGLRGVSGGVAALGEPTALKDVITSVSMIAAQVGAIIVVLFMAHEYRYNMVSYTLTATNSRTKALFSKIIVAITYSAIFTLLTITVAALAYLSGFALRDSAVLQPQTFDALAILPRIFFYSAGFALIGLLIAVLSRSVVFAVVAVFMIPNTVEPLLGLLLKDNVIYLPFNTLQQVSLIAGTGPDILSPSKAALVFCIYMLAGWAIAWWAFLHRDAN